MTTIVGIIEDNGKVWIGGDGQTTTGFLISEPQATKVFRRGSLLIGCAGARRFNQIIQYLVDIPEPSDDQDPMTYLVKGFAAAVRDCVRAQGYMEQDDAKDQINSELLIGFRGCLYHMSCEFSIEQPSRHMFAIGSGTSYALGALLAMSQDISPWTRIREAIRIASELDIYTNNQVEVESI